MKTTAIINNGQGLSHNKKTNILYWVFTGLFAFFMLGSAIPDIMVMQMAVQGFSEMGLPAQLVPFLGVAKFLGVIAILVPGFPKIREWAYAGLIFDLIGAIYLVIWVKPSPAIWAPILIPVALGFYRTPGAINGRCNKPQLTIKFGPGYHSCLHKKFP